jgi:DNA-directed RNA polymerase subunit RPC12/RpoP
MKDFIKKLLREAVDKVIKCKGCGWTWKESESEPEDLYVCHKCGSDNEQYYVDNKKKV